MLALINNIIDTVVALRWVLAFVLGGLFIAMLVLALIDNEEYVPGE
jgi:hypothetical protein